MRVCLRASPFGMAANKIEYLTSSRHPSIVILCMP